jgi:hypothetical protein
MFVPSPGVNVMIEQRITAEFPDDERADRAIGRLEVLGVAPENIAKSIAADNRISVTATVEDRLAEKASLILQGN